MAEPAEVLIYPDLRISELERRAEEAGDRFRLSRERALGAAQTLFHPSNLLAHHKGSLVAAAVSFLLLGKLFTIATKFVAPKLKVSAVWGLLEAGWMWKAMQISYKLYKFASKK